ncbi:MAG: amidohydrolase family protein [Myxococcota bacterium]
MGDSVPPQWLVRVKDDYFKGGAEFLRNIEVDELIEQMDHCGLHKAVLSIEVREPSARVLAFAEKYPDRFGLAATLRPTGRMDEVWKLEELVAAHPVVMARVVPFQVDRPPSDPIYYPLYVKCIELDLPVSINTGIPGPPVPGECQNPMHLDRVCLQLPELRICMAHGADPWWDVAIRLMLKYRNLYLMTSAYAPKYLPAELLHFMNTRGSDKVIFASDHPVLSFERCLAEAQQLDLRPGVLDRYLYENAEQLFFGARSPRVGPR